MATHSSILAWKIPWTEKPGGLYSPWGHIESDTTERLTTGRQSLVQITIFIFSFFTAVDWVSGMPSASGYLNIFFCFLFPQNHTPESSGFKQICEWKRKFFHSFLVFTWLFGCHQMEPPRTLFTWEPKSLQSMHEAEPIMRKNHEHFPCIWTWLEVWEDLDSFQVFKKILRVLIDEICCWWWLLRRWWSPPWGHSEMNGLWHLRIKNQSIGDDIQSPLAKVGIETSTLIGKQALHHITHRSVAWSVGTNYMRKSKSHSTLAHQQFGTHVSNF